MIEGSFTSMQSLLWPEPGISTERELYMRLSGPVAHSLTGRSLTFSAGGQACQIETAARTAITARAIRLRVFDSIVFGTLLTFHAPEGDCSPAVPGQTNGARHCGPAPTPPPYARSPRGRTR